MKTENISIVSKNDGLVLDGLILTPDVPKAVIQIAHGMCEHKERYIPFMEYMVEQGFACVIHDHRGHGRSVRDIRDLGYFYENGAEALVEDLHLVMDEAKQRFGNLPYILFGHSMGSLGVRCFTKKYDNDIDALIVCGSPSANDMADLGIKLIRFLQKIKGGRGKSKLIDSMVMGAFDKPFHKEKLKNSWLSTDKNIVEAYNADPYCNFTFTLNGYEALLMLMKDTYSEEGWKVSNNSLPIHFIAGNDDPCITNSEKFERAVQCMKDIGYTNVTSKLYDGMRHEILNEIDKAVVYVEVAQFCKEIITQ